MTLIGWCARPSLFNTSLATRTPDASLSRARSARALFMNQDEAPPAIPPVALAVARSLCRLSLCQLQSLYDGKFSRHRRPSDVGRSGGVGDLPAHTFRHRARIGRSGARDSGRLPFAARRTSGGQIQPQTYHHDRAVFQRDRICCARHRFLEASCHSGVADFTARQQFTARDRRNFRASSIRPFTSTIFRCR